MRSVRRGRVALLAAVTVVAMGATVAGTAGQADAAQPDTARATTTRTAAKPAWKVTLQAASAAVNAGQKIKLSGRVSKKAAGLLVLLQERPHSGKPWKDQRQARIHADGSYTTYDVPTNLHSRDYRVIMPKTTHRSRGISPRVTVSIYQWLQLTSMPTVNESFLSPVSTVAMNGVDYPASLVASTYHPDGPTSQSVEFNLDHLCTKFRGTFGLSDGSQATSQASVTASADGTPWFSQSFSIGQSMANAVAWDAPPLKISFHTSSLVSGLDGFGAVGTPEVYCTQH